MKILNICKYLLSALMIFWIIHVSVILFVWLNSDVEDADAILIFWNKVNIDGSLSMRLKSRMDMWIEIYNSNQIDYIVVSWGVWKEWFDEAVVMKDYLVSNNITESVIIIDNKWTNSHESAVQFEKISKEYNIDSVIVVSQYFHILRAKLALQQLWFHNIYSASAKMFPEIRDLYSIPREIIGYYVYKIKY